MWIHPLGSFRQYKSNCDENRLWKAMEMFALRLAKLLMSTHTEWKWFLFPFLPSVTVVAERLCFHRCLSVHGREVYTPGQTLCRADTPLGRTPPLPSRRLLQRTVRILLECILVSVMLSAFARYEWTLKIIIVQSSVLTSFTFMATLGPGLFVQIYN